MTVLMMQIDQMGMVVALCFVNMNVLVRLTCFQFFTIRAARMGMLMVIVMLVAMLVLNPDMLMCMRVQFPLALVIVIAMGDGLTSQQQRRHQTDGQCRGQKQTGMFHGESISFHQGVS